MMQHTMTFDLGYYQSSRKALGVLHDLNVQHTELHLAKQAAIALDMSQAGMPTMLGSAFLESEYSC